jgi:hypothetical protein
VRYAQVIEADSASASAAVSAEISHGRTIDMNQRAMSMMLLAFFCW